MVEIGKHMIKSANSEIMKMREQNEKMMEEIDQIIMEKATRHMNTVLKEMLEKLKERS